MRPRTALVLVVLAALVAGGACGRAEPARGEARLRLARHAAATISSDGAVRQAGDGDLVRRGEVVEVTSGEASLDGAGGTRLLLRSGTELAMDRTPSLREGEVVVISGDEPAVVEAARTEVEVRGATRVRRSLAVVAGTYVGEAVVRSGDQERPLPALRELTVPAPGLVPGRPSPLRYHPDDRWDRRWLGRAIELAEVLHARSAGFTAQLAPRSKAVPYRELLGAGAVDAALADLIDPAMPPGEALVGAAVALAAPGDPTVRWRAARALRSDGATWGLIAMDQGSRDERLYQLLDGALARLQAALFEVAARLPSPAPVATSSVAGSRPVAAAPTPTPARPSPSPPPGEAPAPPAPSDPVTVPDVPADAPRSPVDPPADLGDTVDGAIELLTDSAGTVLGG